MTILIKNSEKTITHNQIAIAPKVQNIITLGKGQWLQKRIKVSTKGAK